MVFIQSVFWFLILIGVMILIHELGHFWAARFFDVHVETFSFGFGPRLFGFRRGETDYRVSLVFFLGGFVKMAGELPGDESANARLPSQAPLAAPDHRAGRPDHECGARRGPAHRPVHGEV
jgi:RIP metalloprotease RseP